MEYKYCPMCTTPLVLAVDPFDDRERATCPGCGWIHRPAHPIGVLAVLEHEGGIVLTHPLGDGYAALPGLFVDRGETVESGIARAVREQTGLEIAVLADIARFTQPGTPLGTAVIVGVRAHSIGGSLLTRGSDGEVGLYARDALPEIIPVRAANLRVMAAWLEG
ncbi:hypothetical protein Afil01_45640 [Actinorhabdospora filicis]|uniref:NUDIX domain-containing protein n=1 Tax=Actinorhabdospora filicis TaxID=1785913 RepID=A0A9W6SQ00_9ACTN|nr:NUDIX hydrolase [Actinorhabdospora filicis]GLZ79757.1 hypothetical protein Afil01_45640 [Actinorhabdospora filicis]